MEFGLSKCAVLVMKRLKIVTREGIDMPDGKMTKCIKAESDFKHLGILQTVRRLRIILKSKLNGGCFILAINSRAVSIIRY